MKDAQALVPPGHHLCGFSCAVSNATTCLLNYATCDDSTDDQDPIPPPVTFDCGNDHCTPEVAPPACQASSCGQDCAFSLETQVPGGWRLISANCDSATGGACTESGTICEINTGQTEPLSTSLSCPQACGPPQSQIPCSLPSPCGHDCAADAAREIEAGERVIGSGCIIVDATHCLAEVSTCDANGDQHNYFGEFDNACCGDACCGDPCCGDPCCGDPCCGDPCCGDPCCGDSCCGDPCCEDPECCGEGYGCSRSPGSGPKLSSHSSSAR